MIATGMGIPNTEGCLPHMRSHISLTPGKPHIRHASHQGIKASHFKTSGQASHRPHISRHQGITYHDIKTSLTSGKPHIKASRHHISRHQDKPHIRQCCHQDLWQHFLVKSEPLTSTIMEHKANRVQADIQGP
eukprot:1138926-Pelagomonas_calceolata.AAC.9